MTKFFKDELKTIQIPPLSIMLEMFPSLKNASADIQTKSNKWALVQIGQTLGDMTFQVAVQTVPSIKNVYYYVFLFNKDGSLNRCIPVEAVRSLPPVCEKIDNGLDYFDWLEIQGSMFKYLADAKLPVFQMDLDPVGKMVYIVDESQEDFEKKVKNGESYQIRAVLADIFLAKMKEAREKEEASKKLIITP